MMKERMNRGLAFVGIKRRGSQLKSISVSNIVVLIFLNNIKMINKNKEI